jgi:hypothetical protein
MPFSSNPYFIAAVTPDMIEAHQHMPQSQHWKNDLFRWGRVNEYHPEDRSQGAPSIEAAQAAAQAEWEGFILSAIDRPAKPRFTAEQCPCSEIPLNPLPNQ